MLDINDIPADFAVRPIEPGAAATDPTTCGTCGLSWDDAIPTSYTPAPSARCPFEAFHEDETTERDVALDVLAALEMYAGSCGSETTTIESVIESGKHKNTLILGLSNGDAYEIRIRERNP